MKHDVRNGVTITVEKTGESYHTYEDWGLYVTNANPIGDPVQYTNYLEIPARNGKIDLSEALSGRPIFTHRPIKINLMGTREITAWDSVISAFRNMIMGQVCKIQFDNDPSYFWRGRVGIDDFSSVWEWGKFTLDIPEAEPYKYDVLSSADPWLWNPFNFETGIITQIGAIEVDGTETITIPHGYMPTTPEFVVSYFTSLSVECNGVTYGLTSGKNVIPSIIVGGDADVTLTFTGKATVQVVYRGGSL